jgi:ketosteroid isomerase-like protein
MRYTINIAVLALASVCLSGCNKPTPATADSATPGGTTTAKFDRDAARAEILGNDSAFVRAMLAKNVDSLMPYYDESAVSIGDGKAVKGTSNVRAAYIEAVKAPPRELTFNSDGVNFSDDGTMAWDYGTFSSTSNDAKGKPVKSTGTFLNVWKNVGGHWRIVAEISNPVPPATPSTPRTPS